MISQLKPNHISENDTTSHSSKDSAKPALLHSLAAQVLKQALKNHRKYQDILKDNVNFTFELFRLKKGDKDLSELGELVLTRHMDRLLEDESLLDQELSKLSCTRQEAEDFKSMKAIADMDHFSFLRTVWSNRTQILPSDEKIDTINQKVCSIRRHIQAEAHKTLSASAESAALVLNSKEYLDLKQENERLVRMIDVERNKWELEMETLNRRVVELETKNRALEGKIEGKKQLEGQLMKVKEKLQIMEIEVLSKERELKKHVREEKKNHENEKSITFSNLDDSFLVSIKANHIIHSESLRTRRTYDQLFSYLESSPASLTQIEPITSPKNRHLSPKIRNFSDFSYQLDRRAQRKDSTCNSEISRRLQIDMPEKVEELSRSQEKKRRFERKRFD